MSDARTLTAALRGKWFGGYGLGFCPAHHNTRTPALRLRDGADGRLLALCSAGCGFADVLAALRRLGLLGEGPRRERDPFADLRHEAEARADAARRTAQALALWAETVPAGGTLGERYLRGRCISGPLPEALRFHPQCWHGATASRLPALVAAVTRRGELVAGHRTYLAEPGRKAPVEPAKAMLGPVAGGAVVLQAGPGAAFVGEGVETMLSLRDALADPSATVLAGLSAAGVAGLDLPPAGEVFVCPDDDKAGREAAETLATRAHAAGRVVRLLPPPEGGGDWNDWAQARAGAA